VLGAQVPFVRGGAEMLNEELVRQINLRRDRLDAEADLIQLPYKWYPDAQVLQHMLAWKMIDITEADGHPVDLAIGTKFPSYSADHPNKVMWLVHQHRAFYELEGTRFDVATLSDLDRSTRHVARRADTAAARSCKARFAIAETVAERLSRFNGLDATVLHPPPRLRDRIEVGEFRDYILYVGRLESIKRIEILIDALALDRTSKAVILGAGKYRDTLLARAEKHDLGSRCIFPGFVPDEEYLDWLANCRAVYYAPFDEDYGFATIEAFLAEKPVLTFGDSGEPQVMVGKTGAGWIVDAPNAEALAAVTAKVSALPAETLHAVGYSARPFARSIHWDGVILELVEKFL